MHQVWESPREGLSLGPADVHVWRACLDRDRAEVAALARTLSVDERARAESIRGEPQRWRFATARATLRLLAARYVQGDPCQVQFRYDERGKPFLVDDGPFARDQALGERLSFNVSHTGPMGLFAFALTRRIGIDVERARRQVAFDRIAERFLSAPEVSELRSLQPTAARRRAFLRCWTRKEAYLKATGEGIGAGALSRFAVSVRPQLPARLEWVDGDRDEAGRWRLEDLPLDESEYFGAVCVEGHDWRLRCFRCD